jgi:ubiquinone/menaquinone biosynthesis C-methylase UbiE
MDHKEWFDHLAHHWDENLTPEVVERLRQILARINLGPGETVLDLGSGTGVLIPMLRRRVGRDGEVVAVDLSLEMLRRASAQDGMARYCVGDGQRMPLRDATFQWVVCNSTFPHFPDKAGALREMRRVLNVGGRLLICHPNSRATVNSIHRHIGGPVAADRIPGTKEMRTLLRQAGFGKVILGDEPDRYVVTATRGWG